MQRCKAECNSGNAMRIEWVDAAKAFAVFLVVLGHVASKYEYRNVLYLVIYFFHMPFFFMISGVVAGISPCRSMRALLKREINLFGPALCFTAFNFAFGSGRDIFFYYNGVWFIVFLALIIFIDYFILLFKQWWLYFVFAILWLCFGGCQLVLLSHGMDIAAKFACEASKFCGYLLCFKIGNLYYAHKEKIRYMKSTIIWLCAIFWLALIYCIFKIGMQDNVALTKIIAGIGGGGYIAFYVLPFSDSYKSDRTAACKVFA